LRLFVTPLKDREKKRKSQLFSVHDDHETVNRILESALLRSVFNLACGRRSFVRQKGGREGRPVTTPHKDARGRRVEVLKCKELSWQQTGKRVTKRARIFFEPY